MTDASRLNALLSDLPAEELASLMRYSREIALETHAVLHEPELPIDAVYFPTSGAVSLVRYLQDGKGVECGIVGRDGMVGASIALGLERALNQATVQLPGRAIRISREHFLASYRASEHMRSAIARFLALKLAESEQMTACNASHSLESRLCRWLLQARDKAGNVRVVLTQEFVAQMLGVQRTTVTLVQKALANAGVIRNGRGWVEIADPVKMEAMACECYRTVRKLMEPR
jgi:CRP-like cAMP-binding protein